MILLAKRFMRFNNQQRVNIVESFFVKITIKYSTLAYILINIKVLGGSNRQIW